MKLTFLVAILATLAALAALVVVALYRHKQASAGDIKLIGELGTVETSLDPVGTVIVGGELWRARSNEQRVIVAHARVRVVGFADHLVLVEVCD